MTNSKTIRRGNEIKVNDVLKNAIDGGLIGTVKEIRPYIGDLVGNLGEGTQIAKFYSGMEMTLPARGFYEVAA